MQKRNLFLVVCLMFSFCFMTTAEASTSPSQAKSLIRNLYYGQQQASQRGVEAENAYILSHNYPGMYTAGKECLLNMENQSGSTYGPAVPNLLTIDTDKTWKVPSGLPSNRLSGKTPKGETFVLDVTWSNGIATNHVTVLNGKAYYFLWICGS